MPHDVTFEVPARPLGRTDVRFLVKRERAIVLQANARSDATVRIAGSRLRRAAAVQAVKVATEAFRLFNKVQEA